MSIAAAYPSLSVALSCAVIGGAFAVVVVSLLCVAVCVDMKLPVRTIAVITTVSVLAVIVVITILTVLLHHAAWVDYRRGAP